VYSKAGKAIRAAAQNEKSAQLMELTCRPCWDSVLHSELVGRSSRVYRKHDEGNHALIGFPYLIIAMIVLVLASGHILGSLLGGLILAA